MFKAIAWWIPVLLVPCFTLAAADPHMTADERAKVIKYQEESRSEFLAAIDGGVGRSAKMRSGRLSDARHQSLFADAVNVIPSAPWLRPWIDAARVTF